MDHGNDGRVAFKTLAGRLQPELLWALESAGFTHMTPVQEKVLALPSYARDCLVQAKTGTGKTLAFLLPALQTLLDSEDLPREYVALLVLAPTRELAQQIVDVCNNLTSRSKQPLECHIAVGGSNKKQHRSRFLKGKPTILVATPGRLTDYLEEEVIRERFARVRCVVLDEADRMLDLSFAPAVRTILQSLPPKARAGWQGMCFSATMPPEMDQILPMLLDAGYVRISTIDKNEAPTVETVPQSVYPVASIDDVLPTLHSVLSCARADDPHLKAVVFCPTARHAGLLYHVFGHTGGAAPPKLPVFQMHSRMQQSQRTRTVKEFGEADRGLLFASDVVGRGMDFPDIGLVVQVGVPSERDQYVHRVGRTGRAGRVGRAVMILAPEEMWFVESNPQFPIRNEGPFTHPKAAAYPSETIIQAALAKVRHESKVQAYSATLGFVKSLMKLYRLKPAGVVEFANRFALSIGLDKVPELEARLVGKMGLKGVPGLVIQGRGLVTGSPDPKSSGARPRQHSQQQQRGGGRRARGAATAGGGNHGGTTVMDENRPLASSSSNNIITNNNAGSGGSSNWKKRGVKRRLATDEGEDAGANGRETHASSLASSAARGGLSDKKTANAKQAKRANDGAATATAPSSPPPSKLIEGEKGGTFVAAPEHPGSRNRAAQADMSGGNARKQGGEPRRKKPRR